MAKDKPKPPSNSIFDLNFIYILVGIVVLIYLFRILSVRLAEYNTGEVLMNFWLLLPEYFSAIMLRLFSFSLILSIIFIIFIISASNTLIRVRKQMHQIVNPVSTLSEKGETTPAPMVNEKWQRVVVHINSNNPADWKLAILECDIILSEMLEKMGYLQESISEKLKAVEPSDFTNIEYAWEAHKIRNQIAHEGSEFALTEREAKRVIGLYESVFREFEYI